MIVAAILVYPAIDVVERLSGWRLECESCGYRSRILERRRAVDLLERVHKHRHIVGRI